LTTHLHLVMFKLRGAILPLPTRFQVYTDDFTFVPFYDDAA
jgi:hypothetical protein